MKAPTSAYGRNNQLHNVDDENCLVGGAYLPVAPASHYRRSYLQVATAALIFGLPAASHSVLHPPLFAALSATNDVMFWCNTNTKLKYDPDKYAVHFFDEKLLAAAI